MDIQNVKDAIAAVIAAQQDANAISKDGKAARDTAADSLRKAAIIANRLPPGPTLFGKRYELAATIAAIPAGTVKVYTLAAAGYVHAINSGVDVTTGYGKGEVKNKPMPVQVARELWTNANSTEAEREAAQDAALKDEAIKDAVKRLKALSLTDILGIVELIPALPDSVKIEKPAKETAAERKQREAREELERMEAEESEVEPAQSLAA